MTGVQEYGFVKVVGKVQIFVNEYRSTTFKNRSPGLNPVHYLGGYSETHTKNIRKQTIHTFCFRIQMKNSIHKAFIFVYESAFPI